jgi:hypothetical protein
MVNECPLWLEAKAKIAQLESIDLSKTEECHCRFTEEVKTGCQPCGAIQDLIRLLRTDPHTDVTYDKRDEVKVVLQRRELCTWDEVQRKAPGPRP